MSNENQSTTKPWYRYGLLWLVISIPVASVISSAVLITVATTHKDGMVVDDYYKQGKAINQVLVRDDFARAADIHAQIQFSPAGLVKVQLKAKQPILLGPLTLKLVHSIKPQLDQMTLLKAESPYHFIGHLKDFRPGRWYVQLETPQWRLLSRYRLTSSQHIELKPVSK